MFLVSKQLQVYIEQRDYGLLCAEARAYAGTVFAVRQTLSCPFCTSSGGVWGVSELQARNCLRGGKVEQWTTGTCGTPEQEVRGLQVMSFAAPGLHLIANALTGTWIFLLPDIFWLP